VFVTVFVTASRQSRSNAGACVQKNLVQKVVNSRNENGYGNAGNAKLLFNTKHDLAGVQSNVG